MLRSGDLVELSENMPEPKVWADSQDIILADKGGDGLIMIVALQRSQFDVIITFSK